MSESCSAELLRVSAIHVESTFTVFKWSSGDQIMCRPTRPRQSTTPIAYGMAMCSSISVERCRMTIRYIGRTIGPVRLTRNYERTVSARDDFVGNGCAVISFRKTCEMLGCSRAMVVQMQCESRMCVGLVMCLVAAFASMVQHFLPSGIPTTL